MMGSLRIVMLLLVAATGVLVAKGSKKEATGPLDRVNEEVAIPKDGDESGNKSQDQESQKSQKSQEGQKTQTNPKSAESATEQKSDALAPPANGD